jgi:maltose alpha-D-glucosyltransferase/alpha-amylase
MVTAEDREWMWDQYAPDPRMRINLGIRRRLAPLLDNDPRKIRLANALLFSLPGSPIVYYGDEIGMGDNIWLDDRNGVRTPMQWRDAPHGGFADPEAKPYSPAIDSEEYGYARVNVAAAQADHGSLLYFIRHLVRTRKSLPALGMGSFHWAQNARSVAAFTRNLPNAQVLCLNNLRGDDQGFSMPWVGPAPEVSCGAVRRFALANGRLEIDLGPYEFAWLSS